TASQPRIVVTLQNADKFNQKMRKTTESTKKYACIRQYLPYSLRFRNSQKQKNAIKQTTAASTLHSDETQTNLTLHQTHQTKHVQP
ncbi:MAG: hypothetical protein QXZ30_02760, partial [Candidatus Bilamarchaeaceae archaeon]